MTSPNQTPKNLETMERAYAALLWGTHDPQVHEDLHAAWEGHEEVAIAQGAITGRLRRDDVSSYLGSLGGFTLIANITTEQGSQELQLGLVGAEPNFRLTAISEQT